jgi:MFS family permease
MAMLFRADGLSVTDDWIKAAAGTFAIADVRTAWVTRRQVGRRGRLLTATLSLAAALVVIGGAGLTGWLTRNWLWVLAAPLIFFVAAGIGLLDPIAIYLEKRHHELWIATDAVAVRLWKHNSVEVNKALRAIQRAHEHRRDQFEV